MAIVLNVEDYCQECSYFEPRVRRMLTIVSCIRTDVTCKNRDRCKGIYNYIKKEETKNETS